MQAFKGVILGVTQFRITTLHSNTHTHTHTQTHTHTHPNEGLDGLHVLSIIRQQHQNGMLSSEDTVTQ